jgi:hypothetical protein
MAEAADGGREAAVDSAVSAGMQAGAVAPAANDAAVRRAETASRATSPLAGAKANAADLAATGGAVETVADSGGAMIAIAVRVSKRRPPWPD